MLETGVALVLAHLLADFVLQTERIAALKRRLLVMLGHIAVVVATAWAALGFPPAPWLLLVLGLSHLLIDWLKVRFGRGGFRAFALDQAAHLGVIALVAAAWPGSYAAGLWAAAAEGDVPGFALLPAAFVLAAGLIATVWAGGHAVGALMRGLALPPDPAEDPSLPSGGRLIGQLERLIILVLVLSGEIVAIGLLIAAKSVLRFGDVQRSRQVAEYVIIGTLASFAWAIVTALLTARALAAL